jgi:hypothetical protein
VKGCQWAATCCRETHMLPANHAERPARSSDCGQPMTQVMDSAGIRATSDGAVGKQARRLPFFFFPGHANGCAGNEENDNGGSS